MIRAFVDRMMRPREITLRFREIADPMFPEVTGILAARETLTLADVERLKSSLNGRRFQDGDIIKVAR